ncbi:MAG: DUF3850 domain-containing protein [Patescibacteria group bacterium]
MAMHYKKIDIEYFEQIMNGEKTFELRLADFDCSPGDTLELIEHDKSRALTGRTIRKKVGSVTKTKTLDFYNKQDIDEYGWQAISLVDEVSDE